MWFLIIVLCGILFILLFNLDEPKEFICVDGGKLIDATNTYTLVELFEECTYECERKDYSCLELCTNMISDVVKFEDNEVEI